MHARVDQCVFYLCPQYLGPVIIVKFQAEFIVC